MHFKCENIVCRHFQPLVGHYKIVCSILVTYWHGVGCNSRERLSRAKLKLQHTNRMVQISQIRPCTWCHLSGVRFLSPPIFLAPHFEQSHVGQNYMYSCVPAQEGSAQKYFCVILPQTHVTNGLRRRTAIVGIQSYITFFLI